jgi:hypothetical protein
MACYQVSAQFAFSKEPLSSHKPVLVSTRIEKQKAKAFLILPGLPFDRRLKIRRFFKTKKEAVRYISYLHRVYKNRFIPFPAAMDGRYDHAQQSLFQRVSE